MSAHERRSRNKLAEDEDATKLKLGPDFEESGGAGPLTISEVKLLLDRNERRNADNPVFKKTLEYVTTFTKFEHSETVEQSLQAVRHALVRVPPLKEFEVTQIANLGPLEAEEAKALIPSLKSIPDDELQTMLTNVASVRNFS